MFMHRIVATALLGAPLLLAAGAAAADTFATRERVVTPLATGVYAIRHKDATPDWPNGNSLVVIGEREVLVVDACVLPSAAREDIAQIRRWTDKPVRWLVNTHWHIDHNAGNRAYLDAFPGLAIVAQRDTKQMMDEVNPGVPARFVAAYTKQVDAMQKSLDAGTGENGRPLAPEARAALADDISSIGDFIAEYQQFRYQSPTLAIERSIAIDLGRRVVEVKFLGRGNTLGDLVVQLPAEKIVATGDLLDHPVPYMLGGYPGAWIDTLDALEKLGADTFLPGHGEVLHGTAHLADVRELIRSATRQVHAEIARKGSAATLEAVQKVVDLKSFRARMAGDDPVAAEFFDASAASLVRNIYHEAKQR
jgi:glyoxylase-like metal-dependent hydrolase (beta-lactamase superfamily II)